MRSCSWWLIKFFQKSLLVFSLILGCNQRKDLDPERVKIPFSEPIKNLSEIASKVTYISLKDEANSFLGNLDKLIKKHPQNWQDNLNPETSGYLRKMFSEGTGGNPTMPLNVNVTTTVHPNGASTTKIATAQNVKVVHNPPGTN